MLYITENTSQPQMKRDAGEDACRSLGTEEKKVNENDYEPAITSSVEIPNMKRTAPWISPGEAEWQEQMDQDDAKEVSLPPAEVGKFLDAQAAILAAGYRIRTAEIVRTHPIWFFVLDQANAPRIRNADRLMHHVRDIMRQAGLSFRDDDAMLRPDGRRLTVSFMWPTPARGKRRELAWEEGHFDWPHTHRNQPFKQLDLG
jgi:hypothetical protein